MNGGDPHPPPGVAALNSRVLVAGGSGPEARNGEQGKQPDSHRTPGFAAGTNATSITQHPPHAGLPPSLCEDTWRLPSNTGAGWGARHTHTHTCTLHTCHTCAHTLHTCTSVHAYTCMHIHAPHVHTHLGHVRAHRSNTHEQHKVKTHQVARVKGPGSPSERSREGCALGSRRAHTLAPRLSASLQGQMAPARAPVSSLDPGQTDVTLPTAEDNASVSWENALGISKTHHQESDVSPDKCHGSCARTRVGTRARATPHGLLLSELLGPAPRRGGRGARDRLLPHGIALLRTGGIQPRPDPHGATTTEAPGTEFPASPRSPHRLQGCRALRMLLCPGPRLVLDILLVPRDVWKTLSYLRVVCPLYPRKDCTCSGHV